MRNTESGCTSCHKFQDLGTDSPELTGWASRDWMIAFISDPEHPREASSVNIGNDEYPHWLAADPTNTRLVVNSGGSKGNRLFILNYDKKTGALAIDKRFRNANDTVPGLKMSARRWPNGWMDGYGVAARERVFALSAGRWYNGCSRGQRSNRTCTHLAAASAPVHFPERP
jgi:hypothetical protein